MARLSLDIKVRTTLNDYDDDYRMDDVEPYDIESEWITVYADNELDFMVHDFYDEISTGDLGAGDVEKMYLTNIKIDLDIYLHSVEYGLDLIDEISVPEFFDLLIANDVLDNADNLNKFAALCEANGVWRAIDELNYKALEYYTLLVGESRADYDDESWGILIGEYKEDYETDLGILLKR